MDSLWHRKPPSPLSVRRMLQISLQLNSRTDIPNKGIVFTLMTVRLAMRSSKTLMTTTGGGFPIEWRVPGTTAVATTEFGPTIGTVGTTDVHFKSIEFGGSHSDHKESESQQFEEAKERTETV